MTDRELLELAAKAIGQDTHDAMRADWLNGHSTYWNPLADDGDAFRLATKIGFEIRFDAAATQVFFHETETTVGCYTQLVEKGDAAGASRRAIVCAAAEIGRQMEEK